VFGKLFLDDTNVKNLDYSNYNETTNKLTLKITPDEPITKGEYEITLEYTGMHGDDMHGFYRSYYVNEQNETK